MGTILTVTSLLVAFTLICNYLIRRGLTKSHVTLAEQISGASNASLEPVPVEPGNKGTTSQKELLEAPKPWKVLSTLQQLQLALVLAQKAMPVWTSYATSNQLHYNHAGLVAPVKFDSFLLPTIIDAITIESHISFPVSDKRINQYYSVFIGPVIAIQDGIWTPPYPVKKIFLGVYNILKSIEEQRDYISENIYLDTAITQFLDCLDLSKFLSNRETAILLEKAIENLRTLSLNGENN